MTTTRLLLAVSILSTAGWACATSGGATAADDDAPVVTPQEVAWKDMTKEQRGRYMKKVVAPRMAELLQAFDPKEFAEVKCVTCHGDGAKDKTFKMPNGNLPDLPGTPEGFKELANEKPEWVKFMSQQVKPEMAKLLNLPEFDPRNPQEGAFGCHNCHKVEGH